MEQGTEGFLFGKHSLKTEKLWGGSGHRVKSTPKLPGLQGLSHGSITPILLPLQKGGWGCSQNLPHPSGDLSGHSQPGQDGAVLLRGSAGNKILNPVPGGRLPSSSSSSPLSPALTPPVCLFFFFFSLGGGGHFSPRVLIFWGEFFFFFRPMAQPLSLSLKPNEQQPRL